ncbi:MAG: DUF2333 family protein [Acidobacteriota bacterium]|nr:DUF2333 family protein [Acidobacteriota bacterium]
MKDKFKAALTKTGQGIKWLFAKIPFGKLGNLFSEKGSRKWIFAVLGLVFFLFWLVGWYWNREPGMRDIQKTAMKRVGDESRMVTGVYTSAMLIEVAETLLEKPGGYLSNDVAPPSVFLDNMPNWEFGALVQVRDLARSMRNDMSRSRSQSEENKNLAEAEPLFNYDHDSWVFPASERQYRKGIRAMEKYLDGLSQQTDANTQFYARADNLRDWLAIVEKRLGSMSQRLSASVGQARVNTDLAGDEAASQSTSTGDVVVVKTPWLKIDDVFYEARGGTWALLHFMQAVERDFESVLEKKNARALVRQIIRELEGTQRTVWSPLILNGSGFGLWANHSLVMASYISRANAAVIDLRELLSQG